MAQSGRASQHLQRGSLVNVEGMLKTRSYDDHDRIKRYGTELMANQLIMLDRA
jgi:single-strand DNA-binding protein